MSQMTKPALRGLALALAVLALAAAGCAGQNALSSRFRGVETLGQDFTGKERLTLDQVMALRLPTIRASRDGYVFLLPDVRFTTAPYCTVVTDLDLEQARRFMILADQREPQALLWKGRHLGYLIGQAQVRYDPQADLVEVDRMPVLLEMTPLDEERLQRPESQPGN